MTNGRPLVIGFGNPLRGDDALGPVAAELLSRDPRLPGVTVWSVHQLAPEMAEDVAAASRLVVLDAVVHGSAPGTIRVDTIAPEAGETSLTHHVTAGTVLALARELHGHAPPAVAVTVAVEDMGAGERRLSPAVAAAVPTVVDTVVRLVREGDAHA